MMVFGMVFGLLFMLLILVGLIAGAVVLVRSLSQGGQGPESANWPSSDGPREVLDRRYASGEITREEYEGMKQDIQPRPALK